MADFFQPHNIVALLTLTALEIVLGIDNVVFLAILAGKLPQELRERARRIGLTLAMFMRIGLLLCIGWVMKLTTPLFTLPILAREMTGKDLILLGGGLFLIYKASKEIHHKVEAAGMTEDQLATTGPATFSGVIVQILIMDLIFSLDSVITAFGMTQHVPTMIVAVVVSVGVMLAFSGHIVRTIDRHPSLKILALSFLLLIGIMLVGESLGKHIEKGYIYFAMAFAVCVDLVQIKATPPKYNTASREVRKVS